MDQEYKAYLIRLTRKPNADHWRVHLEDPHSNFSRNFATEHELLRFLARQLHQKGSNAREDVSIDL